MHLEIYLREVRQRLVAHSPLPRPPRSASLLRFLKDGAGAPPLGRLRAGRAILDQAPEAGRGWPWPSGWGGVLKDAPPTQGERLGVACSQWQARQMSDALMVLLALAPLENFSPVVSGSRSRP